MAKDKVEKMPTPEEAAACDAAATAQAARAYGSKVIAPGAKPEKKKK